MSSEDHLPCGHIYRLMSNPSIGRLNDIVPQNITRGIAPLTIDLEKTAEACCARNELHIVREKDCIVWCELPEDIIRTAENSGSEYPASLSRAWGSCLSDNMGPKPKNTSQFWYIARGPGEIDLKPGAAPHGKAPGIAAMLTLGLLVAGMVMT